MWYHLLPRVGRAKTEPGGMKGCCKLLWKGSNTSDAFLGFSDNSFKCLTAREVGVGKRSSVRQQRHSECYFSLFALDYWLF